MPLQSSRDGTRSCLIGMHHSTCHEFHTRAFPVPCVQGHVGIHRTASLCSNFYAMPSSNSSSQEVCMWASDGVPSGTSGVLPGR